MRPWEHRETVSAVGMQPRWAKRNKHSPPGVEQFRHHSQDRRRIAEMLEGIDADDGIDFLFGPRPKDAAIGQVGTFSCPGSDSQPLLEDIHAENTPCPTPCYFESISARAAAVIEDCSSRQLVPDVWPPMDFQFAGRRYGRSIQTRLPAIRCGKTAKYVIGEFTADEHTASLFEMPLQGVAGVKILSDLAKRNKAKNFLELADQTSSPLVGEGWGGGVKAMEPRRGVPPPQPSPPRGREKPPNPPPQGGGKSPPTLPPWGGGKSPPTLPPKGEGKVR